MHVASVPSLWPKKPTVKCHSSHKMSHHKDQSAGLFILWRNARPDESAQHDYFDKIWKQMLVLMV